MRTNYLLTKFTFDGILILTIKDTAFFINNIGCEYGEWKLNRFLNGCQKAPIFIGENMINRKEYNKRYYLAHREEEIKHSREMESLEDATNF